MRFSSRPNSQRGFNSKVKKLNLSRNGTIIENNNADALNLVNGSDSENFTA